MMTKRKHSKKFLILYISADFMWSLGTLSDGKRKQFINNVIQFKTFFELWGKKHCIAFLPPPPIKMRWIP